MNEVDRDGSLTNHIPGDEVLENQTLPRGRLADEFANWLTHGLGLVASIVGLVFLVIFAAQAGSAFLVTTCSVYGATLVFLYGASTLYHRARDPARKALLRMVDHASIYLLIAGTYTPFTLVGLGGWWGWSLFGVVWVCAILGILFKLVVEPGTHDIFSTTTYVVMGWLAVIAVKPMMENFPLGCLLLILGGGLAYTFGVGFYFVDHRRFAHATWHLFVLAGSVCHYVAIVVYVVPAGAVS